MTKRMRKRIWDRNRRNLDRLHLTGDARARERERLAFLDKSKAFRAAGLNCFGETRTYKVRSELEKLHGKEREKVRRKLWEVENIKAGLTHDGKPRALFRTKPNEERWRAPSLDMQKTLALFDAPSQDERDVLWFVGFLANRGWTTAESALKHVGKDSTEDAKRWIRGLAERSGGLIVGTSKGYRLTKDLTDEEYRKYRNAAKSEINSRHERVLKTDLVRGWKED